MQIYVHRVKSATVANGGTGNTHWTELTVTNPDGEELVVTMFHDGALMILPAAEEAEAA